MTSPPTSNLSSWPRRTLAIVVVLLSAAHVGTARAASCESDGDQAIAIYTQWNTYTTVDGLPSNEVRSLYASADSFWVGTTAGLAAFDGVSFHAWAEREGLPPYPIERMCCDSTTRDLWIATFGGGLVRMSGGRFFVFNQFNSGLAGDIVFDVEVLGDEVWAATNGGLSIYRPVAHEWRLGNPRTQAAWPVWADLMESKGGLLGLAWKHGITAVSSGDERYALQIPNQSMAAIPGVLAVSSTGDGWWAATDSRIYRSTAGATNFVPLDWFEQDEWLMVLAATGIESAWVGTTERLHQLSWDGKTSLTYERAACGTEVTLRGASDGVYRLDDIGPAGPVRAIAWQGDAIWVATDHGLARGTAPVELAKFAGGLRAGLADRAPAPSSLGAQRAGDRAAIAVYGPRNRTISVPGAWTPNREPRPDVVAVELAVEMENARTPGPGRIAFEPMTVPSGYARYGWGLPEDDVAFFEKNPAVVGIIGHITEPITDLVASRGRVPWLNTGPGSRSGQFASAASNPMVFRCFGDLPRQHRTMFDFAVRQGPVKSVAFFAADDPVSRLHIGWWVDYARQRQVRIADDGPFSTTRVAPGQLDAEGAAAERPDVVFISGDADFTIAKVRSLRQESVTALIVTGPAIVASSPDTSSTLTGLGEVMAFLPDQSSRSCPTAHAGFAKAHRERDYTAAGRQADEAAFASLHAADHLMHAVKIAGPDCAAVRRVLSLLQLSCFGEEHFEREHTPAGVSVAEFRDGAWHTRQIQP